jgi:hypothetical protein
MDCNPDMTMITATDEEYRGRLFQGISMSNLVVKLEARARMAIATPWKPATWYERYTTVPFLTKVAMLGACLCRHVG